MDRGLQLSLDGERWWLFSRPAIMGNKSIEIITVRKLRYLGVVAETAESCYSAAR
jgi:hypothetical protein